MTGTYDPELDLVYWGTGNPTPVLTGKITPRRRSLYLFHRRLEPQHRQTRLGVSAFPARYPRLGRGPNYGAGGRRFPRQAHQNADAGLAQRLCLRARPHHRKSLLTVPFGPINWALGIDKKGSRFRILKKIRRPTAGSSPRMKAALPIIDRPA